MNKHLFIFILCCLVANTHAFSFSRKKPAPANAIITPQMQKMLDVIESQVASIQQLNYAVFDLSMERDALKKRNFEILQQSVAFKNKMAEENTRLKYDLFQYKMKERRTTIQ